MLKCVTTSNVSVRLSLYLNVDMKANALVGYSKHLRRETYHGLPKIAKRKSWDIAVNQLFNLHDSKYN